jgi:hypothetical protein
VKIEEATTAILEWLAAEQVRLARPYRPDHGQAAID